MVECLDGGRGNLAHGDPSISHQALRPTVVEPHQDAAGRVRRPRVVGHAGHGGNRPETVLDPRHGLGPVPCPHLLDAEGQNGAVRGARDHGGEVQGGAPPGAGVVDIDDRHIAHPGLTEPGLAAHTCLIVQPARRGVADDDQPELIRRKAGVGQRLVGGLVGHRLW